MGGEILPLQPPQKGFYDINETHSLLSDKNTRQFNGDFHNKSSASSIGIHKWRLCPKVTAADRSEQLQFESQSCVPAVGWTVTRHAASHALDRKRSRVQTESAVLLYAPAQATNHWTDAQRGVKVEALKPIAAGVNGRKSRCCTSPPPQTPPTSSQMLGLDRGM